MPAEKKDKPKKWLGPHGVGDPDDFSLRNVEKTLLIPQLKSEIIRTEKCPDIIQKYQECVMKAGLILGPLKCKQLKLDMAKCIEYWHDSDELYARAKELYIADRREFRLTGVCRQNREYFSKIIEEEKLHDNKHLKT